MNLIGNAIRLNALLRNSKPNHGVPVLLRDSPRCFSAETEVQKDLSIDPFLQPPTKGLIYGRLTGTARNTWKTDVINLLEGCNLSPQDIKFEYNRSYLSTSMMLQFPSRSVFDSALRLINRKGRLYRLDKAERGQWDYLTSYDGKVVAAKHSLRILSHSGQILEKVLLQGIPRNALPEDVERFLSGCDFDASSIQMFVRPAVPDPIRMALVRFPLQTEAVNAALTKNRSFCLNNQITVRVLQ